MKRRLVFSLWTAAALIAPACSAASGQDEPAELAESPKTPAAGATWVEAATLARSSAKLELVVPGEVEGSREATLASAQGGYVEAAKVEVGDDVEAGDLLFRIDTALYQARFEQLRAELRAAEREKKRAEKLGRNISGSELDETRDRYVNARAALKTAQVEASRATIKAPFSGVIARVDLEEGEVAGAGTPAARLIQLDPAKITLSVPDRDVVGLEPGIEVEVFVDTSAKPRTGKLVRINPAADLETRAFTVDVEVANPDRTLLPGMIARVHIEQTIAEDRLVIPQNFLVTKRKENGVYIIEEGIARWRPLELGTLVRDQVVVEGGLEVGDNVVVVGHRMLADGDALIISRQGQCCTNGRPVFDQ